MSETVEGNGEVEGSVTAPVEAPADDVETSNPLQALETLARERDQLAAEKAEVHDQLLRKAAEFENFRRRMERSRVELLEYAAMEAVRSILPVLDDFERALKIESADKEYARGLELIYQRLFETLKRLGLEPMESVGQPFDPHVHHAVEMAETEEAEDHTVLAEHQRGYTFKGRLLRPAMVKVAVKPQASAADPE